jgi:two-component system, LytTR family, sensor kinase
MHTHPLHIALLLHLSGFLFGLALYGMLLGLAVRSARFARRGVGTARFRVGRWLGVDASNSFHVFAGIAGVVWNAGALVVYGAADVSETWRPVMASFAAYSALGFLPAAAAHSALRSVLRGTSAPLLVSVGYGLSGCAALLNAHAGVTGGALPSAVAMRLLTVGFVLLALLLFVVVRRQLLWRHAPLIVGMAVFAVTAVHLVDHRDFGQPVWLQVLGHHAAVPLAVAILVQDYPFAFSDLLLKRMLSLAGLVGLGLAGVLAMVASPLSDVMRNDPDRPVVLGTLLLLIVTLALAYQAVRAGSSWFVDRVILRRRHPDAVLAEVGRLASVSENEEQLIDEAGRVVAAALKASGVTWHVAPASEAGRHPFLDQALSSCDASGGLQTVGLAPASREAAVLVPTTDAPCHVATIGPLPRGRPFLSADVSLLRDAALILARRIDAIRMGHERFERQLREQEHAKLAIDAELHALRAQINPHFLFNALTTIGYLVRTDADQALRTLLRLTELLRRVLRTEEELVTVATELQLVEAYLEIERARFEERLRVSIDVPDEVKHLSMPSFVLQPLVENAVKHGVAASRAGGTVSLTARIRAGGESRCLVLTVADTGSGGRLALDADGAGIGLGNVRRRLELAYGPEAEVILEQLPEGGTRAVVTIPIVPAPDPDESGCGRAHEEERR